MSDAECEACGHLRSLHSAVDIGDPSVGVEPTEPHCEGSDDCGCTGGVWFRQLDSLRAAVARLTRERDELVPCGWWPLYEMGCTVSAADLYLSRLALAKAAGQILADHPDAGVK